MDKRTKKIIKKKCLNRWLKPAKKCTDIVDFVIIENLKCLKFSFVCKTDDFLQLLKNNGEHIPKYLLHYTTISNKRNRQTIFNDIVTNKTKLVHNREIKGLN